jgi:hypothetical protein
MLLGGANFHGFEVGAGEEEQEWRGKTPSEG